MYQMRIRCEEWIPFQNDDSHQDEIRLAFHTAFSSRDRDDWVEDLAAANCCVAPVQTIPEVAQDEQYESRNAFMEAKHDEHGSFRQVGPVLAGGNRDQPTYSVPPGDGTDTDEILGEAGFSQESIRTLRADGVLE